MYQQIEQHLTKICGDLSRLYAENLIRTFDKSSAVYNTQNRLIKSLNFHLNTEFNLLNSDNSNLERQLSENKILNNVCFYSSKEKTLIINVLIYNEILLRQRISIYYINF